ANPGYADDRARRLLGPAGDARDERVLAGETGELRPCPVGDARGSGVRDDRCQGAVDVEEERRRPGLGGQSRDGLHRRMIAYTGGVTGAEEIWFPLVDEPIGAIVGQLQGEDPEILRLVDSPRKLLAFRTFAYLRVGILLGKLLVENDVPA